MSYFSLFLLWEVGSLVALASPVTSSLLKNQKYSK